MSQLNAYITFDGNCAEAMRFYESVLGGKLEAMIPFSDAPQGQPMAAGGDRIMHARLAANDTVLMASDTMDGQPYEGMKGFSLSLSYPTADQARRVFEALSAGGRVTMPLQKTFWAELFGMLVDRFGTPWIINGGPIVG